MAYLVFRDAQGMQRSFALEAGAGEVLTAGRGPAVDLPLAWDPLVSRVHAEFARVGRGWGVVDDGLSSNGTYVNGERLRGRRRLARGDEIRLGGTRLVFQTVTDDGSQTMPALEWSTVELSPMQRLTLFELCRPCLAEGGHGTPATNAAIAEALCLTQSAVKKHMRALFVKFAIGQLPQNQKRTRLVTLALERGLVSERDLAD